MAKFIKYEKALLEIEGQSILAESAELGVEAPPNACRKYNW